jgi:acyl carrier protein
MNKQDFLLNINELLELESGTTVDLDSQLAGIESWDSLTVVGFIALIDEKFELVVPASKIANCNTVGDLMVLVSDKITD